MNEGCEGGLPHFNSLFVENPLSRLFEPAAPKIKVVLDFPTWSPIGLFVAVYGRIVEHDVNTSVIAAIANNFTLVIFVIV